MYIHIPGTLINKLFTTHPPFLPCLNVFSDLKHNAEFCFVLFFFVGHRVSHCFTDSTHSNVFAFVTASGLTMSECHAFMCSKRKMVRSSLSCRRYIAVRMQPRHRFCFDTCYLLSIANIGTKYVRHYRPIDQLCAGRLERN